MARADFLTGLWVDGSDFRWDFVSDFEEKFETEEEKQWDLKVRV